MSQYANGDRIIYLTGPNGQPYTVEVGDALDKPKGTASSGNIFGQILGAIPSFLGALFPNGVAQPKTPTYSPAPGPAGGNVGLGISTPLLIAIAAVIVVLFLPKGGGRRR